LTIVAKVWIEEDCITCDACQDICPEVFLITEESSQILAAVRTDGQLTATSVALQCPVQQALITAK